MSNYILDQFNTLGVELTKKTIRNFNQHVLRWELRDSHPLSLNTQLLGVHTIVFIPADRAALFEIFALSESEVSARIRKCPSIDRNHRVASDPFNLFSIWLLHEAVRQIEDPDERKEFQLSVAKYLHYKFFTSLVNHYFPHRADEAVMLATINSLNRRFDIIVYGTWRKTIEARAMDLVSPDPKINIHAQTIATGQDDAQFMYVVTDVQTRIRAKIGTVSGIYYDFHRDGVKIQSAASTKTDAEGEKILVQRASTFDTMTTALVSDVLNINAFIDAKLIRQITSLFPAVSPTLLRVTLEQMSERATEQSKNGTFEDTVKVNGLTEYTGIKALIQATVEVSFRYCVHNRIPLNSKYKIFDALRNRYSSSHVNDPDILSIKNSYGAFIDSIGRVSRAATKASLRIAMIMYVITRCFAYL